MKPNSLAWAGAVLLPAALVLFVSCASKNPSAWDPSSKTEQQETGTSGFAAQTYSSSVTTTSTVVSVDAARRTLMLKQADGTTSEYQAGQEVTDFAQIKPGSRVRVTVGEQRSIRLAAPGTALSDRDTNSIVRPTNGQPAMAVNTHTVVAKVVSVSYWDHSVAVKMADGKTSTVKANAYTNLALVNPGDEVWVQVSEARTLVLDKP